MSSFLEGMNISSSLCRSRKPTVGLALGPLHVCSHGKTEGLRDFTKTDWGGWTETANSRREATLEFFLCVYLLAVFRQ